MDNVEDPNLVISALPTLAGGELTCTILYTSRSKVVPTGITTYSVKQLSEEGALRLLLETTRPSLLIEVLAGSHDVEAKAARLVCQSVGYLPLALMHLHGLLARDERVTIGRLLEVLKERGTLEIAKKHYRDASPLFATFWLSWEKVRDEEARRLFKLASYFPEAASIPLWLLGLAAGLGEHGDIFEPLGDACMQLQELSLLEALAGDQVRLHPLVREFGQGLQIADGDKESILLREASEHLIDAFTNITLLEQRALREGYWGCLEHVRAAREYAELLRTNASKELFSIERWLDRESSLLRDNQWWPDLIPGLFYQQLFNRSMEEGHLLREGGMPTCWLRQIGQVGAEDKALLRVFVGHTKDVLSVAFSPDGKQVLTGSQDQTARLWETRGGKLLRIFQGHTDSVQSVAFSPDGKQVLTGAWDRTARLWETRSGKLLRIFQGLTHGVYSVAFSVDGKQVLTGSQDQTARLWEIEVEESYWHLLDHILGRSSQVMSLVFSPDGRQVLTGSEDGIARLWETKSGKLLKVFQGHTFWVNCVAFSPDGRQVLTGSLDRTARLWEIESGKLLRIFQETSRVAFSPDGRQVLTSSDEGIARLWETESERLLRTFEYPRSSVESVAFSRDSNQLVIGLTMEVQLWDTKSGILLRALQHDGMVTSCVAFSPTGRQILIVSGDWAQLWDTKNGKLLKTLRGHPHWMTIGSFSPDGRFVITCDQSGSVFLWCAKGADLGKLLAIYVATYEIKAVYWQNKTHVVLADDGSPNGFPHFYRLKLEGKW